MLELVATTPSRPLGAVVVPLDMSVSLNLFNISLLDRERRYAGYRNYLLYAKSLKFPTVLVPRNQALGVSAKRQRAPENGTRPESRKASRRCRPSASAKDPKPQLPPLPDATPPL